MANAGAGAAAADPVPSGTRALDYPRAVMLPGHSPLRSGYSLFEVLIVLALAGLFVAWSLDARPGRVTAAGAALRTHVVHARFEAIERNSPVAVVYREREAAFVTLSAGERPLAESCDSTEVITRLDLAEYPGVRVVTVPSKGLVWLPSGTGRTCRGGGAFNQTLAIADGTRKARVVVSRAGRVRLQVER